MGYQGFDITNKVILVTGGTSGIGRAIALGCAQAGAKVVAGSSSPDKVAAIKKELGGGNEGVQVDVADAKSVQAAVDFTVKTFGRIDGLVNAAGLTSRGTLLDTTPELFDAHLAVNLRGPFFAMRAAVADMVARGAPGTIVNIGSNCAHGGPPHLAAYSAAKAGLAGLTRNAAHAHRWDRIRINTLNIGWTATEGEDATQRTFHGAGENWREEAGRRLPMGRLGDPAEIAEFVVLLLSDRSGVVTGSVLDWDQQVPGGQD